MTKFLHLILSIVLLKFVGFLDGTFVKTNEKVLVKTEYGTLRGSVYSIVEEGAKNYSKVNVFLGIPFAKAPVEQFRFETPEEPSSWNGEREAAEYGPACIPHVKAAKIQGLAYDEDCLHLNIFAPSRSLEVEESQLFPVLFYIHGGGFELGSASYFQPEVLADYYASEGVIFVSVQYRLGPLGFASNGQASFPGNNGLWDQIAALKYVNRNIYHFGGDANKITLVGNSAGSCGVSALSVSTHSRDLFAQAIEMSGSIYSEWALSDRVVSDTFDLSKSIGCSDFADGEELKNCLKSKSTDEIMDAVAQTGEARPTLNSMKFHPRVDRNLFADDPFVLAEQSPKKPTIIGVTNSEALLFTLFNSGKTIHQFGIDRENFDEFGREKFSKFIRDAGIPSPEIGSDESATQMLNKILEFYLENEKAEMTMNRSSSSAFYLQKYSDLVSDRMFVVPSILEAKNKAGLDWPVYFYLIDYFNANEYPSEIPVKGSYHTIDLDYLFDLHVAYNITQPTEADRLFRSHFINAVLNFAKTGDPSTAAFHWPSLQAKRLLGEDPIQVLRLNPSPKAVPARSMEKVADFWIGLGQTFGYDLIRGGTVSDNRRSSAAAGRQEL